ncbi:MAG: AAA family ATPase [Saprospiraceae bacterium]
MSAKRPLKIVFTGPESSGKTTLTSLVAKSYQSYWLPEFSRTYLTQLNRPYIVADLVKIAEGQLLVQQQFAQKHSSQSYLFHDTSLLVIKVWSIFKYGFYNFKLEQLLRNNLPDIFFLCDWQIPWEYDPLRETPNDRAALYAIYKAELIALKIPFFEITGSETERLNTVRKVLHEF